MQYYTNKKKIYEVESVELYGAIINVNGTSITDLGQMYNLTGDDMYKSGGYTVFVNSDEVYYDTFEEAYDCAMNKQKNTFWLED
jgi:hypothetical protein